MARQSTLDFGGAARSADPWTSHAAASSAGEFAGRHRSMIVAALAHIGPMTPYEIAEVTELETAAVFRRMSELERMGLAMPTGDVKKSPNGRSCRVWGVLQ